MRLACTSALAALAVLALNCSAYAGTTKWTRGTGTLIYDTFQDQTVVLNPFPTLTIVKDAPSGR